MHLNKINAVMVSNEQQALLFRNLKSSESEPEVLQLNWREELVLNPNQRFELLYSN